MAAWVTHGGRNRFNARYFVLDPFGHQLASGYRDGLGDHETQNLCDHHLEYWARLGRPARVEAASPSSDIRVSRRVASFLLNPVTQTIPSDCSEARVRHCCDLVTRIYDLKGHPSTLVRVHGLDGDRIADWCSLETAAFVLRNRIWEPGNIIHFDVWFMQAHNPLYLELVVDECRGPTSWASARPDPWLYHRLLNITIPGERAPEFGPGSLPITHDPLPVTRLPMRSEAFQGYADAVEAVQRIGFFEVFCYAVGTMGIILGLKSCF